MKQKNNTKQVLHYVYLYILKLDNRIFYTGITNNPKRRFKEHNQSNKGFTSKYDKKEIIFLYLLENRKAARNLEIRIKRYGALRFIMNNLNSIKNDKNTKYLNKKQLTLRRKT